MTDCYSIASTASTFPASRGLRRHLRFIATHDRRNDHMPCATENQH
uniref:Uncharacterized protein n=1 Tax=Anguilla anguilla TaxID=7936 RepID=A0A0E9WXJ4_ANGAN